ncbi:winged helix-turn-helix transcriptional regulator [Tissierella sp.]|uniref:winged helix-turn-helix transcriptional regulator n=1 Tax=Tissierella sp. TaxID=41274 RepID=UPI0028627A95|nr:winged helix-turn-helix transcriptional regulator [Tissierella sp.]MDR7857552.1 winged helix-turn-helix transcriptional regulator [Tissierella sp.]
MDQIISNIKFFTPTAELKELTILQYIENNEDTTQKELAEVVGSAPSMINVYITDLESNGYILRDYISPKTIKYKITYEGIKRKNYLIITYLHELLRLYKIAKENVEKFLEDLENKGCIKILLYGAGEVAKTILSVIRDRQNYKLNIIGIIDDDEHKEDTELFGYRIITRFDIGKYDYDAIVITSYTYEDRIRERLEEIGYVGDRIVRFFG